MGEGNVEFALERSFELQIQLSELENKDEKLKIIKQFIKTGHDSKLPVLPEFDKNWEWFNTTRPLSARSDLSGRIVVLDFFTYCCINCIHILPDLHRFERTFTPREGVVVVGVHSAKFDNEKGDLPQCMLGYHPPPPQEQAHTHPPGPDTYPPPTRHPRRSRHHPPKQTPPMHSMLGVMVNAWAVSANILSAVLRYDITHPVVNDSEASLWQQLQVSCWPTLVILGPRNEILLTLVGEGHSDMLHTFVTLAKEFYENKGELKLGEYLDWISLEKSNFTASALRFPGKLAWDPAGKRLAISDTGQHRVLITDTSGVVEHVVGGKGSGLADGSFEGALFFNPQGVTWRGDNVYVADTDNHCVRQINVEERKVTTIVGTGVQGQDKEGGKPGTEQPISSPWDLTLGSSLGAKDDVLFIAMAGTHQIWMYFFEDAKWIKNSHHLAGTCARFAGSGQEENRNNNYPHRAAFAQPSGVSLGQLGGKDHLFIADAESSSVRTISLTDGAVKGLVGGDRDPTNLFAYGDADGVGVGARLQHPLGVAVQDETTVLVADSYNHKIKKINLATKECLTIDVTKVPPLEDAGGTLNEPGGICVHPHKPHLYIADTNNHAVKILDLQTQQLSLFPVILRPEEEPKRKKDITDSLPRSRGRQNNTTDKTIAPSPPKSIVTKNHTKVRMPEVSVHPGSILCLALNLQLEETLHLTEEAPSLWQVRSTDDIGMKLIADQNTTTKSQLESLEHQPVLSFHLPTELEDKHTNIDVECVLYYCGKDGACRMKGLVFEQPVWVTNESVDLSETMTLTYKFTG